MQNKKANRKYISELLLPITIVILLQISIPSLSQDSFNTLFKYPEKILGYTHTGIHKTEELIDKYLDQKDSLYISPNIYKLTLMAQYSNCYEYYRFSTENNNQKFTLSPDNSDKLGIYVGWKWIFLGWSFDINSNKAKVDLNFSFYTSKVGIDIFYRKRDKGFKIKDLVGFKDNAGNEIRTYNGFFDGISVKQKGVNVYYIFNNKKFSYPAAYSQTTNQRISCGSFILGLNYAEQSFHINTEKFDDKIQESISSDFKFNEIKYKDYSINFGYSYNWVFARNCLANISLTPAIGYKNTSFKFTDSRDFIKNINFDLITRIGVVYNNSRYFIGLSHISHTYSYRKTNISIVNGFGTINLYAGFNLFKK